MKCYHCGKEISEGAKFCSECGKEITVQDIENKQQSQWKKRIKYGFIFSLLMIVLLSGIYMKIYVFTPKEGARKLAFTSNEQSVITEAKVEYTLKGMGGNVQIESLTGEKDWMNQGAGVKSTPIDITVTRQKVEKAKISFLYDEKAVSEEKARNLCIAYYNEELGRMELLENSKVDTTSHTVSVETTHFSRYVVVDSEEWYEAWAQSQLIIRDESVAQNYFDIVFTLDCSDSMNETDKNELSKECTYSFIQNLYEGDYFTVFKFNDNVTNVLEEQRMEDIVNWDSVYMTLREIDASGGTNIEAALDSSVEHIKASEQGATQLIVLLSDGQADVGEAVIQKAVNSKIRVISIGFGANANEELLRHIAVSTGGQYYKAGEDNIEKIFERIREEYVGVDLNKDSDHDGIPDKIETTGMRNQYGKVIQTNSNDPDTDDDGISDGIEMGEIVIDESVSGNDRENGLNKYVYFEMATDPNIYDENVTYNPRTIADFTFEVSDDKTEIEISGEISNGALKSSLDKTSNKINDIENTQVIFHMPECMKNKNPKESLGDISSGEVKKIQKIFEHDKTVCNGEKHVAVSEITGENIKNLQKELRLNGLYWFESIKDGEDMPGIQLVEKVKAYSSTYDPAKIEDVISDKQMSQEEILEFWEKERNDSNMRWRLNYLCNDDIYVAHHFRLYMENQNVIEKGVIDASKLVFSDGVINTVINQPEKNRYKQMLLEYINSTMEERQKQYQIKDLMNGYEEIIGTYSQLTSDLQRQQIILQQECKTAVNTINSNLEYLNGTDKTVDGINQRIKVLVEQSEILEKNNVQVDVTNNINSNVLQNLEQEYNRLSGISKAASTTTFVIGVTADTLTMFDNITKINAVAQTYEDYEQLLGVIIEKTQYPELKKAAEELQSEMRHYYKLYANESWNFMMNTGVKTLQVLTGVGVAEFCGQASGIVSTVGITAAVTKLFLNVSLGIDDMLESAVYVVGASEIADILSEKMIECREEFQLEYHRSFESAYAAAEKFRYYYIELQQMRIFGEEKYLELKGMNGAWDMFGNMIKEWNQYEKAHEICGDTIEKVRTLAF